MLAGSAAADPQGGGNSVPWRYSIALQLAFFQPPDTAQVTPEPAPFSDLFGEGQRIAGRLELGFGRSTLSGLWAVTTSVGYWQATGHAQDLDALLNPQDSEIYLRLIPISIGLLWRGDFLRDLAGLPFVPYGRVGYGFVAWSSGRSSGSDVPTSGWAFGLEYGGGIQLLLDALDKIPAAESLHEIGLRSTAVFVGFRGQAWNDPQGPSLSSNGLELGLMFLF